MNESGGKQRRPGRSHWSDQRCGIPVGSRFDAFDMEADGLMNLHFNFPAVQDKAGAQQFFFLNQLT